MLLLAQVYERCVRMGLGSCSNLFVLPAAELNTILGEAARARTRTRAHTRTLRLRGCSSALGAA